MLENAPITDLFVERVRDVHIASHRALLERGIRQLSGRIPSDLTCSNLIDLCVSGAASLFIVYEKQTYEVQGFYVIDIDVIDGEVVAEVCYAFALPNAKEYALLFGLQKSIEFAIIIEADKLIFNSPRKGWLKVARKMGFDLAEKREDINRFIMDFSNAKSKES